VNRRLFNLLAGLSLLPLCFNIYLWKWSQNHLKACCSLRWSEQGNEIKYIMTDEGVGPWGLFSGITERTYTFADYTDRAPDKQATVRNEFLKYCSPGTTKNFWCDSLPNFDRLMYLASSSDGHSEGLRLYRYSTLVGWLLVFPVLWLFLLSKRRWTEHKHERVGCCKHCGYDLRATPDHCPECGSVPETLVNR